MCHAVDPDHGGTQHASVAYMAACPVTETNKKYAKSQLQAALAGKSPPDCVGLDINKTALEGYKVYDGVPKEGKTALGFDLL